MRRPGPRSSDDCDATKETQTSPSARPARPFGAPRQRMKAPAPGSRLLIEAPRVARRGFGSLAARRLRDRQRLSTISSFFLPSSTRRAPAFVSGIFPSAGARCEERQPSGATLGASMEGVLDRLETSSFAESCPTSRPGALSSLASALETSFSFYGRRRDLKIIEFAIAARKGTKWR